MKQDKVQPSFVTLTTLCSFFSKIEEREMLQRADSLLQSMEKSKRAGVQPDHRQYAPVIKGWLSIGDLNNATRVLIRSIDACLDNSSTEMAPNTATMDMVIEGWIKAGDLDSATLLLDKIQKLKDKNFLKAGPSAKVYRSMLGIWQLSMHPDKTVKIQELQDRLAAWEKEKRTL